MSKSLMRAWKLPVIVLLVGALLAFSRITDLPADSHEAYVLQTAHEMRVRNEWIVPWFNDTPRLQKPPLSYWATRVVVAVTGSAQVREWHGRLLSAVSMLGLVVLAFAIGRACFDSRTALLAAAIVAGSHGFFAQAHDARPDALYAFLCSALYASYWRRRQAFLAERDSAADVVAMWAAAGLAVLCKGPQLPVLIALACLIDARLSCSSWHSALRCLRPLSGGAACLAMAAPWWLALRAAVGSETLAASQLSGSLLTLDWRALFTPYYPHRSWWLLMPWFTLGAAALHAVWQARRHLRPSPPVRWLWLLVLVGMVGLGLGPQRRLLYMLPLMVPMALLLAHGTLLTLDRWPRRTFILVGAHALCGLVGLGVAWYMGAEESARVGWALWTGTVVVVMATLYAGRRSTAFKPHERLVISMVAVMGAVLALSATGRLWSRERFREPTLPGLARVLEAENQEFVPRLAWGLDPAVFVYYGGQPIRVVHGVAELRAAISAEPAALVYTPSRNVDLLRRHCGVSLLGTPPRDPRAAVLARIESCGGGAESGPPAGIGEGQAAVAPRPRRGL